MLLFSIVGVHNYGRLSIDENELQCRCIMINTKYKDFNNEKKRTV